MSVLQDDGKPLLNAALADDPSFNDLTELALDLRWFWDHGADAMWRSINPELWDSTRSGWAVLQTASADFLQKMPSHEEFRSKMADLLRQRRKSSQSVTWFKERHAESPLQCAAYFSMEYMLSEALPIYSGGLGNVAGDQLKAADDLGVPIVAVGLLYQQGYFRQALDAEGNQLAVYPYNDPGQLPITPLRTPDGEWLRMEVKLPGFSVWLRAWQAQVGRVKLLLLDSNDPANLPVHRGITGQLYGGGPEMRLQQEMVLGLGGWRLLEAMGLHPDVCHLNEGHAAFAVLERARSFMEANLVSFDVALAITRAGNVFTTHTAVPAGFDRFTPDLMQKYMSRYSVRLGISLQQMLALGRLNPNDPNESFNMAFLAVRGSGAVNGVSRLHGEVSRGLFSALFPRRPLDEVPIGYVTNGVHVPSWDCAGADELWTNACGKERWLGSCENLNGKIEAVPDDTIWTMRNEARHSLVQYARERAALQAAANAAPDATPEPDTPVLNPDALTLGFARRFATYKRPNLLLHDPDRLARILANADRPVQILIAGKAHPADAAGQEMIREWIRFLKRPDVRGRALFLVDYDMTVTENLVAGVDVWLNTPRRPWEACGTSGMKVLVNGGINLSELDGWWAEAYTPQVGWAIGDGAERGDDPAWDVAEAEALFGLIENEVIPQFYTRDEKGIPRQWVERIRASMAQLTPQYSAARTVMEYAEQYYLPAAQAYRARAGSGADEGRKLAASLQDLKMKWDCIAFRSITVHESAEDRLFEVGVHLNGVDPKSARVELYANSPDGNAPESIEMKPDELSGNELLYSARTSLARPASDYTPRVVPVLEGAALPLECPLILWQR